jgi:hypothetical protein
MLHAQYGTKTSRRGCIKGGLNAINLVAGMLGQWGDTTDGLIAMLQVCKQLRSGFPPMSNMGVIVVRQSSFDGEEKAGYLCKKSKQAEKQGALHEER